MINSTYLRVHKDTILGKLDEATHKSKITKSPKEH